MFKFFRKNNEIYHMASMARSGETLLLKILAVHPEIEIVHNLDKEDDLKRVQAFEFLKSYQMKTISRKHPVIRPYRLSRNKVLLLKQGVWKHPYTFQGFILSRNPVSIYASLKVYDKELPKYNFDNNFWFGNEERILRWLKDIDKEAIPFLPDKTPVEQFCFFYNLRMKQLLETKLPIIRYEDLVLRTEETLKSICSILNLGMNKKLLNAHNYYETGLEGHGKNDLSRPIDKSSLTKFNKIVSQQEFNYIAKHTQEIYSRYRYEIKEFNVKLL